MCSLYVPYPEVYASNLRNASRAADFRGELVRVTKGERQIKLRRRKAISERKTKGATEAQEPEREALRLNESGLSSDHYARRTTCAVLS